MRVPVVLALGALGLYLRMAAPTITWQHGGADGGELSAAALVLGVAHPPGYPLYLLLGHLFTNLPVGEVAFRVGLLSAASASLGVGLAAYLAGRLACSRRAGSCTLPPPSPAQTHETEGDEPLPYVLQRAGVSPAIPVALAAVAAGAYLACAPLYWSQAVIQEVYALHAALALGTLVLLERWKPGRKRTLAGLGLILGLGFSHHLTIAFLAAPAVIYIIAHNSELPTRPSGWWPAVVAFLLGLSLYIYLPLRAMADPPLNWGNPSTLPRFLDQVAAASYRGYFGGRSAVEVLTRVPVVARIAIDQLTWPGLLLAFVGLAELARRRPAFFKLLLGYMLLTLLFALFYNAQGGEVYLLPLVPVLAVGLGIGTASLAQLRWGLPVAILLLIAIPSWQIWTHAGAMDLSGDRSAATYARTALDAAAPGATLYTDRDEQTFALWYVQIAEGLRPDVVVVDRRLLAIDWYREQLERRHPGFLQRSVP